MVEFTREMYNDLKKSGYINDDSLIIQMSHEIGKELSDILYKKPESLSQTKKPKEK
jgi:hypothetical protein